MQEDEDARGRMKRERGMSKWAVEESGSAQGGGAP